MKVTCFHHGIAEKLPILSLNNNHALAHSTKKSNAPNTNKNHLFYLPRCIISVMGIYRFNLLGLNLLIYIRVSPIDRRSDSPRNIFKQLSWFRANHLLLLDLKAACLAVKHQMQLLQCLVWPGLELTIYDTRGKHACLVWPGLQLTIYDTRGKHAYLVWPGLELITPPMRLISSLETYIDINILFVKRDEIIKK
jgi:hypothetical protein